MILRRVAEHVREQNWTAIGIDFLIVVVGARVDEVATGTAGIDVKTSKR